MDRSRARNCGAIRLVRTLLFLLLPGLAAHSLATTFADELAMYERSPTRCDEGDAPSAATHGLEAFHDWARHRDKAAGRFRAAGQALAYLHDTLGCRDALIAYRYGNLRRLNKDLDRAIPLMRSSLEGIRMHYPILEATVERSLGEACSAAGRRREAIDHYRRALALVPFDAGIHLNLANVLLVEGHLEFARTHVTQAMALPLSPYGRDAAVRILERIDAH